MNVEATDKQIGFINHMCYILEIEPPYVETIWEAKKWIKEHINEYEDAMSIKTTEEGAYPFMEDPYDF